VILAQLTISFGPVLVPAQDGFRLIMAIGSATALLAFAIAAFIPGMRRPGASVPENRHDEVVAATS
jgi:hypothetical protein